MAYLHHRFLGLVLSSVLGLLAACAEEPGAVECATGIICPSGTSCAAAQPVCIVNSCGNGRVDVGEQCDDGNILVGDGCSPGCADESCGDGVQVAGERCDDGNTTSGDGCSADCLSVETCGNSIKDVTEACDDGNTTSGDGCSMNCLSAEVCGNGIKDVNETCDDGNTISGDACSANCEALAGCGNGLIDVDASGAPVEQCDDGNTTDTDDCRNNCKRATCGDGVEASMATGGFFEECDGGTLNGTVATETATCNIDCTDVRCGDGKVNQTAAEQCDNGTLNNSATCDNDCTIPVCGDNHVNAATVPAEACDPGAVGTNTAGCDSDCTTPSCGDNHVNTAFGDQCEDGNNMNGDGCSNGCQLEPFALSVNRNGTGTGTVSSAPAGINCGTDCSEIYLLNQMVTLTATPAAKSVFTGWEGACTGSGSCVVTMDAAKSVTATFDLNRLTVTKSGTGSGTVTGSGVNCGGDCSDDYNVGTMVTLTAAPALDSVFTGWTGGGCTGTGTCTVTMNAATTVNANFDLNNFTLTVTPAGTGGGHVGSIPAGIDCGATCMAGFTAGTVVTLIASPDATSTFTGWSGACSGTANCVVTMSQARAVTATFAVKTFALTVTVPGGGGDVTSSPAGIACPGDCSQTYTANTMVTLTAAPDAGKAFAGWGGACSGTGSCVVTMDAAKSVSATFVNNRLTVVREGDGSGNVSSNPGGINCGGDCSQDYNVGQSVTLTATAASGSRFAGWSGGACSGTGTCVVTMNGPLAITANFVDLDTLSVDFTGAGAGTVTSSPAGLNCTGDCSAEFDDGSQVTLTATASSGSIFTGWSNGCSGTGTCVVNLTSNTQVTANFAQTFTLTVSVVGAGTVTSVPTGINCGADCTETYVAGTAVTLTPMPATTGLFTGWSGDCSGTGSCVVTMSAARNVTATFNP
ncbi:MAG: DUF4215 domain-containing protein [Deltaproteobacteria bacterium]|nr:DUF4215 domain-containing protein [Deltaproteobacteria bacterium]MDQ3297206.1 DUF4215 domain-containing protein [Myxococcota bacterium]